MELCVSISRGRMRKLFGDYWIILIHSTGGMSLVPVSFCPIVSREIQRSLRSLIVESALPLYRTSLLGIRRGRTGVRVPSARLLNGGSCSRKEWDEAMPWLGEYQMGASGGPPVESKLSGWVVELVDHVPKECVSKL